MNIEEELKNIFQDLFEISSEQVNDESSSDNIEKWDSLGHLNLVMAIEQTFKIKLKDKDIVEMLNFGLIKEILKDYNIN